MEITRRALLKSFSVAGAAAAVSANSHAFARERKMPAEDAAGMLYDATKCIGCKTCMVACKKANNLPDDSPNGLWDAPVDLNGKTKNIIKLIRDDEGSSYVKAQCMHCVDPACVSVCMMGALHKGAYAVVEYDANKCIGCRYCQVACPFNVPKFEWTKALPKIVKCEMCKDRLKEGKEPACTEVCPTKAVIFGKRSRLLAEAKRRIEENPDKYYPKVYGEHDAGGTQVLYLSALPFEKLGLPGVGNEPLPAATETVQHAVYKGFVAPVALYALLGGVLFRNRTTKSKEADQSHDREVQP